MPLALIALVISSFAVGTTELIVVGLLPDIASDLHISLSDTGLLVSIYAISVILSGTVLMTYINHWNKKNSLLMLMILCIAGNTIASLSTNYSMLIVARILTGIVHGAFFGIASSIATDIAKEGKSASAVATVLAGITISVVVGVPLGTWFGHLFGWRMSFFLVSIMALIGLVACFVMIPSNLSQSEKSSLSLLWKILSNKHLTIAFIITASECAGIFTILTFLVPFLEKVVGFDSKTTNLLLIFYGISNIIGNIWGGKLADRYEPIKAIYITFFGLITSSILFALVSSSFILTIIVLIIWGVFVFAPAAGLQIYVMNLASKHLSQEAVSITSGANVAAFNLGITVGSSLGSSVVASIGLSYLPWVSALYVAGGLILTGYSHLLNQKALKTIS